MADEKSPKPFRASWATVIEERWRPDKFGGNARRLLSEVSVCNQLRHGIDDSKSSGTLVIRTWDGGGGHAEMRGSEPGQETGSPSHRPKSDTLPGRA